MVKGAFLMTARRSVVLAVVFMFGAGCAIALRAQEPSSPPEKPVMVTEATVAADQQIMAEIKEHNGIMANLEYLSDMIGQRLTGSDNLKKANQWTREKFGEYGLGNTHMESWQIAHSWTRGTARGRILSPAEHPLTLASYGWASGTEGVVRGPVVYVKASTLEELQSYKGKLKGAIVISAEPAMLPQPDQPAINPMLVPYRDSFLLVAPRRAAERPGPGNRKFIQERNDFFKAEGVSATLVDSRKPDGLLNMTGRGGRNYTISPIPAAFTTSENYSLIWRLLQRGPVEVEIEISNTWSERPVEVYNTVAEIPGSEKPEECVILGAHLDSWDLGTGTTDNGTGSVVLLEAARALQKLGLKPKRTIRFVLFSGEEQGLNGSRAYVEAHKDQLPKISAALIHDTGTGKVISMGLMNNYQDMEIMEQVVAPLHSLGLLELSERAMGGSDHASFNAAGVPGFYAIQDAAQYFQTHHTQADTFDQAHEADLMEGAQVVAVWAYNVAQLPDLLPRKPVTPAPPED
jgi:hypothetical protein